MDKKKIELLDPNITACPDFDELLGQLIESKAWVNFNQGLDIRCMTQHKAELINQVKFKMLHFAWDNPNDPYAPAKLQEFSKVWKYSPRRREVYVLTNFGSTLDQDLMRVYKIREWGYDPYIMIYDKPNAPKILRHLQRYVNNKFIFWSPKCPDFDTYMEGKKC